MVTLGFVPLDKGGQRAKAKDSLECSSILELKTFDFTILDKGFKRILA
jgi:hypothetical protein